MKSEQVKNLKYIIIQEPAHIEECGFVVRTETVLRADLSLSLMPARLVRAIRASKFCSRVHSRQSRLTSGRTTS